MWTTPVVSSTVTNCSPDACTSRLGAAEAGQDQRLLAGDQVGAIELGRDLHGQPAARDRLGRCSACRASRDEEVAAQPDEDLHLALVHRLDRLDGVEAVLRRAARSRTPCPSAVEERRAHLLPDADGAIALHVAVPAHRAEAGAAPPDLPAQQREVHDALHVGDAVVVLGDPHRPAADHPLRRERDRRRLARSARATRRSPSRSRPSDVGVEIAHQRVEPLGVVRDEVVGEQLAAARRDPSPASPS